MSLESIKADMCAYCNNYFNPHNIHTDPVRDYPIEFVELAERIYKFRTDAANAPRLSISEKVVGLHQWQREGAGVSWQHVFAADLAIWKRARFI